MVNGAARIEQLESRVRTLRGLVKRLKDLEEIRGLRFHYHSVLNDGRWWENFDRCTDDVVCKWGEEIPPQRGRETNRAASAKVMSSGIAPSFRQFIHCHLIKLDGETATGRSYMEASPIQFGKTVTAAARWHDQYLKLEGRWWIKQQILDFFYQVRLNEGWAQTDRVINPFESLEIQSNV